MRLRHVVSYSISWLRADFVGLTVCKVLGHKEPRDAAQLVAFEKELDDLFRHRVDPDLRMPICERCGASLAATWSGKAGSAT
jgi:hypothetical protein